MPCDVCDSSGRLTRGLCDRHYQRLRRHGDPRAPDKRAHRGGRTIDSRGYVLLAKSLLPPEDHHLLDRSYRVLEHRLVMARHLGRPLTSDESVHHKNGVRKDNRLDNLELRVRYHGSGIDLPDAIAHAISILTRYAPHELRA